MDAVLFVLVGGRVRPVNAADALVPPALAEGVLVVEQTQLLDDVVHDQIGVHLRLVGHVLLVGLAEQAHLVDVEALVGVDLEHADDQTPELLAVLVRERRKLAFGNPLEQLVQVQVFFVRGPEGRPERAEFIGDAAHAPHVRLPVVAFALEHLGAHVERRSDSGESLEGLGAELSAEPQVSNFEVAVVVDEDVGGLEIPVHDAFAVHVLQGTRDLVNVGPDLLLLKLHFVFLGSLEHQLKISLLGPLYGNK